MRLPYSVDTVYLRNKTEQKVQSESDEIQDKHSCFQFLDNKIYFVLKKNTFRFYFQKVSKENEVVDWYIS